MSIDVLFRGATVVDGSGRPAFRADVAVEGDRIAAVGDLAHAEADARRVVDANDRALAPGFIDVHSHSDLPLFTDPRNLPKVRQGITTELLGADGLSYAPLTDALQREVRQYLTGLYGNPSTEIPSASVKDFLDRLDGRVGVNTLYMVPHQALRLMVRGWRGGPATDAELGQMKDLLEEGLQQGARGLGTGLDYFPQGSCTTDELVELCKIVHQHDGVLVSHVRYGLGVVEAVREMVTVAERSGVRVLVSHLRNAEALPVIDEARARGLDVQFDTYPYNAGCSMLLLYLPMWAHEGGPTAILERLRDPAARERLRADRNPRLDGDLSTLIISNVGDVDALHAIQGHSFAWVMQARGQTDPVDTLCDLIVETNLAAGFIAHGSDEDGLRACIAHPAHLASTDAVLVGQAHPRAYGTYPRYLGHYVRELGVLSLEECVRRMTSGAAQCMRIDDRGLIQPGLAADLVLFNPDTVIDRATYDEPEQDPLGIEMVMVNGRVVVEGNAHTGELPGRALRATARGR